jgi:hypothetical protein
MGKGGMTLEWKNGKGKGQFVGIEIAIGKWMTILPHFRGKIFKKMEKMFHSNFSVQCQ